MFCWCHTNTINKKIQQLKRPLRTIRCHWCNPSWQESKERNKLMGYMHKYISSKHWTAKDLRLKFSNVNSPPPLFLTFSLSLPYLCVIKLFSATNYNHALLKIIKKFSLGCADVKEFIACLFFSFASLILCEFSERCYCSFLRLFFFAKGEILTSCPIWLMTHTGWFYLCAFMTFIGRRKCASL